MGKKWFTVHDTLQFASEEDWAKWTRLREPGRRKSERQNSGAAVSETCKVVITVCQKKEAGKMLSSSNTEVFRNSETPGEKKKKKKKKKERKINN